MTDYNVTGTIVNGNCTTLGCCWGLQDASGNTYLFDSIPAEWQVVGAAAQITGTGPADKNSYCQYSTGIPIHLVTIQAPGGGGTGSQSNAGGIALVIGLLAAAGVLGYYLTNKGKKKPSK